MILKYQNEVKFREACNNTDTIKKKMDKNEVGSNDEKTEKVNIYYLNFYLYKFNNIYLLWDKKKIIFIIINYLNYLLKFFKIFNNIVKKNFRSKYC